MQSQPLLFLFLPHFLSSTKWGNATLIPEHWLSHLYSYTESRHSIRPQTWMHRCSSFLDALLHFFLSCSWIGKLIKVWPKGWSKHLCLWSFSLHLQVFEHFYCCLGSSWLVACSGHTWDVNHMFPSTSPESYTLRITSLRLANTQIKMDTLVSVLKKKYLEFRTLRECSSDKRW